MPPQVPVSRYVVFYALAAFGLMLDLLTKQWMFDSFGMPFERPTYWIWEGVLGVTTSLNEGTLFSLGQGATGLFAALSVVTAIGILVWLFWYRAAHSWAMTIAMGCVMAGALGNLYDRIGLTGLSWNYANALHGVGEPVFAVRDWIDVRIIDWPIFNVADSFIVCGTIILAWQILFRPEPSDDAAYQPEACPVPVSNYPEGR